MRNLYQQKGFEKKLKLQFSRRYPFLQDKIENNYPFRYYEGFIRLFIKDGKKSKLEGLMEEETFNLKKHLAQKSRIFWVLDPRESFSDFLIKKIFYSNQRTNEQRQKISSKSQIEWKKKSIKRFDLRLKIESSPNQMTIRPQQSCDFQALKAAALLRPIQRFDLKQKLWEISVINNNYIAFVFDAKQQSSPNIQQPSVIYQFFQEMIALQNEKVQLFFLKKHYQSIHIQDLWKELFKNFFSMEKLIKKSQNKVLRGRETSAIEKYSKKFNYLRKDRITFFTSMVKNWLKFLIQKIDVQEVEKKPLKIKSNTDRTEKVENSLRASRESNKIPFSFQKKVGQALKNILSDTFFVDQSIRSVEQGEAKKNIEVNRSFEILLQRSPENRSRKYISTYFTNLKASLSIENRMEKNRTHFRW